MNPIELNKRVVTRLLGTFESGNLTDLDEIVADAYLHNIENMPPGREALKQYISALRAAVPDIRMPVLDMIAEGDRVAVRHRTIGTQQGDFGPWKARGNRFEIDVFQIFRLSEGVAVEHWESFDRMALDRQLTG